MMSWTSFCQFRFIEKTRSSASQAEGLLLLRCLRSHTKPHVAKTPFYTSIYIGCKYLPYRVDIADNKNSNGYDNYWSASLEYGGEH